MGTRDSGGLTLQDIANNPNAYGVPTFDQYCKNPDLYRRGFERLFTELTLGPDTYRKDTREIWYWVGINKCKTMDRAHVIMRDMGWDQRYVGARIDTATTTAGKLVFNVRFYQNAPKETDEVSGVEGKAGEGGPAVST
jgi:hypothetical protein